jgi:hypothetical protein
MRSRMGASGILSRAAAPLGMEYAQENGCEWDDHFLAAWPRSTTTWTTLRYAHENGCDFDAVQYSNMYGWPLRLRRMLCPPE